MTDSFEEYWSGLVKNGPGFGSIRPFHGETSVIGFREKDYESN